MSLRASEKYKKFKEFMLQELEITKDDIEYWAKDAIKHFVKKELNKNQYDLTKIITNILKEKFVNTRYVTSITKNEIKNRMFIRIKNGGSNDSR